MEIKLPKLGESIVEATIVQWFKKEGDFVGLDEALLEVSTDKVNSEIPSPIEGVITKVLVNPNDIVKVGEVLALISSDQTESEKKPEEKVTAQTEKTEDNETFLSPAVLRMAKDAKMSLQELDNITRTGEGNRLTKKDVENYIANKSPKKSFECPLATERIKMNSMRKMIADNMVKSFYEAPHATLINEVDVTELVNFIKANKEEFFAKYNLKLSITSFVAKAIADSLQVYPLLNSSLDNDTIVMKKFINLGIAVSVEHGVLVPVIENCHKLSILEISRNISKLAEKARSNSLNHDEVKNGTITLTNFGMAKVKIGIPIIRYPEVAIIGLGAIEKVVKVLPNDTVGIRHIINICLTFDHRVLDGMYGCGFLNELQKNLESSQIKI
jgi:2-oxoglutarate dehydrogenase E2 component (dihydrolipoamide succinyltransferase)